MRKAISVALSLGLLAGAYAMPADAAKRRKKVTRVAEGNYVAPATVVGNCTQVDGIGCIGIQAAAKEKFLMAEITDAHGQPVAVQIDGQTDEDINTDVTYGTFCGKTDKPIKIDPGVQLVFWIGQAEAIAATACAPGMATQGDLKVTLSNLP